MAEQFSVQLAGSFEKVITPTFKRMNESLDLMVMLVTRCQQDAVKGYFGRVHERDAQLLWHAV